MKPALLLSMPLFCVLFLQFAIQTTPTRDFCVHHLPLLFVYFNSEIFLKTNKFIFIFQIYYFLCYSEISCDKDI